ncbi:hypothetical protein PLICRDRAFT_171953 [Plicaturopsis crispa FD-325 SS-3]|nr:hypothetical protein PLICRDRAFT_171953 [Plicaturopsis crispa FD-325 SS-3]
MVEVQGIGRHRYEHLSDVVWDARPQLVIVGEGGDRVRGAVDGYDGAERVHERKLLVFALAHAVLYSEPALEEIIRRCKPNVRATPAEFETPKSSPILVFLLVVVARVVAAAARHDDTHPLHLCRGYVLLFLYMLAAHAPYPRALAHATAKHAGDNDAAQKGVRGGEKGSKSCRVLRHTRVEPAHLNASPPQRQRTAPSHRPLDGSGGFQLAASSR